MYILAIETTGAYASVALLKSEESGTPGQVISKVQGNDRFSHLQNLTPQIEQVMAVRSLSIDDMDVFAVSHGPGSFTGIRIGVSTVRALAQITGKPCIPVSSLEALALRAAEIVDGISSRSEKIVDGAAMHEPVINSNAQLPKATDEQMLICPILDARRGQVYGGGYVLDSDGCPEERIQAGPYTIEEFMDAAKSWENIFFTGDGIDSYGKKIKELRQERIAFAPEDVRYQNAEQVAKLGEHLLHRGEHCSHENLKPNYMRLPEAERKLREKGAVQIEKG